MKRLLALILAMVLVVTLGACATETQPATEGTSPAGEKGSAVAGSGEAVTLTLQIDKDTPLEGIEAVIAAIERDLNIKTEIEIRVGGSEGDNVIKTRLASGDMADMFLFNVGAQLQTINPEEYLIDISEYAFSDQLIDDFKESASVSGKLYGIPAVSTQAGAWLYNKKVYADLGLQVPKTWSELLANCEVIKAAAITPVAGSYKDDWTSQIILLSEHYYVNQADPEFASKFTANQVKYATNDAARRGFEKLAEIAPYLNSDYLATTYDVALDMLANGEAAHYPMLTQGIATIDQLYPEIVDDIGVFAQPGDSGEPGLTVWMPAAMYGYNGSDKKETIVQWMEYYTSQKGVDAYSSAIQPNGPYAIKGIELSEDAYQGIKDMQAYFDSGQTSLALEFQSPVKGPNAPQICVSVGSGIVSPQEGAEQFDQDMEKQAIQLNLPGW